MKKKLLIIALLVATSICFAEEVRTWTRKNGVTVEGTLVKKTTTKSGEEGVTIQKTDGTYWSPPLRVLSEADQAYIKSTLKE